MLLHCCVLTARRASRGIPICAMSAKTVYHGREMFDLFLSLIDEGVLDGLRPGFAVNDNWWSVLYSMAQSRPELVCETIGHWFDRAASVIV